MSSPNHDYSCDLLVIGAGSGGLGAAIAAARMGLSVWLVDRAGELGGNAVHGGVHNWEPCAGATGLPLEIYAALRRIPKAAAVTTFGRHLCAADPAMNRFPGGELLCDSTKTYRDTLQRCGSPDGRWHYEYGRDHWHSIAFEPEAYKRVAADMLAQTGRVRILLQTAFTDIVVRDHMIQTVVLSDGQSVHPRWVVDGTADVRVAAACGVKTTFGQESREAYQEPSAPLEASTGINGVSLIYRITRTQDERVEPLPPEVSSAPWRGEHFPVAAFTQYPCGDYNVNMLPTLSGEEFLALGYPESYRVGRQRVLAHWHHVQESFPEFRRYRMSWVAPSLGVREGPRIIGRYVLKEQDLRAGLSGQTHSDIIAIADHALDTHGRQGAVGGELKEPYGVPLRCLIPQELENLLVACRGAGFSSLAASSCRLSRTMMQLGQAAGVAVAHALRAGVTASDLPVQAIRQSLREQGVQLEWPMSQATAERCAQADA